MHCANVPFDTFHNTKPASWALKQPLRQPFTAQHSVIMCGGSWGLIEDRRLVLVASGSVDGGTVNSVRVAREMSWIEEAAGMVWRIFFILVV